MSLTNNVVLIVYSIPLYFHQIANRNDSHCNIILVTLITFISFYYTVFVYTISLITVKIDQIQFFFFYSLKYSWAKLYSLKVDTWIITDIWILLQHTHPLIGNTDDPGIAADHQKDKAEERHVPSAKHTREVLKHCTWRMTRLWRKLKITSWFSLIVQIKWASLLQYKLLLLH